MKLGMRRSAAGLAVGAVIVTSVAGCGDRVVKKSDLQSQVKEKVVIVSPGQQVGAVTCKDDLKAKVKATTSCTVDVAGTERKVTVTVNQVDGNTVRYNIAKDGW
ncbi:DUF4333 domain-containing protein [Flexivirga sp. ID2601S]|uniref:DUF4333 domain-containing protein n=1 Tax=Flexivirga aerilata TaxID=1656889 RepID=A0A849AB38_9MICO|nr:DUF4333 domain-containing protein [Flexivirga aerilata]NNG38134.1 DUF4333 domain-containing protein [Flexivirga aerilata]